MATQIPGAPAEGTDYDPGLPASPQGADPYTPADDDNWTSATLPSGYQVGAPEQLLICQRTGFKIPVSEGLVVDGQTKGHVRAQSRDSRHPLDFIRATAAESARGSISPEPADIWLGTNDVSASDL